MKLKFFVNVTTVEELKGQFKKLAFKHHPDLGGNVEDMQLINAEYEYLSKKLANTKYTDESGKERTNENMDMLNHYKDIIEQLIHLEGLKIELVGTWLWVSGETKQYKDILKALKFYWNKGRGLWQFNPNKLNPDYKPCGFRGGNKKDTESIKDFYGCEGIKGNRNKRDFTPIAN